MDCICGKPVEPERVAFGLKVCKSCAFNGMSEPRKKGIMIYGHKTAGECQIVSQDNLSQQFLVSLTIMSYSRFTLWQDMPITHTLFD